jgi:hypothetical protein
MRRGDQRGEEQRKQDEQDHRDACHFGARGGGERGTLRR